MEPNPHASSIAPLRCLVLVLVIFGGACGGGLAPPDPGPTFPIVGAGFIGVTVARGTTAVTVAIDRHTSLVDALFAPATCRVSPLSPPPITDGFLSAGTIEVDDQAETVLVPQADGSYPAPGASSAVELVAGGKVDASATGADVPAFMLSLVAPSTLSVTSPDPGTAPGKVDGKTDLEVTWAAQHDETVRVALYAKNEVLACDFASETGTGTLPASAIAPLRSSDAELVVTVFRSVGLPSATVPIELVATLEASAPSGQPYLYEFMLQ